MNTTEGVRLQVPLSSSQCTLLFPKNALLFLELTLCFPELPFYFLELTFCFPEVSSYFSKMPYCFSELPTLFPEVSSFYLLCASFSKNAFFPVDCTLSSSCSELLRQIFPLLLFCFLLELFIDQLMMPCILLVFIFQAIKKLQSQEI